MFNLNRFNIALNVQRVLKFPKRLENININEELKW